MSEITSALKTWEKISGRKLKQVKNIWTPPKEFLESSEYITIKNLCRNRLSGDEPIFFKKDWFTMGIVCSKPKITRGNLGNGFISFDILDPLSLSFVTPVLVDLKARYARDFDLSGLQLPRILDSICLYQPKYVAGVESYSRRALVADSQYLINNCKAPSRTATGNVFKRDISGFKKASIIFIIGKADTLKLCLFDKCKVIVNIFKHELCDAHLTSKFNKMKGQRMEIASSSWGFDIFDSSTSGKSKGKEFSQLSSVKGPESFLLESEEMVTIYPASSQDALTAEELEKQRLRISRLEENLSNIDNQGGQMIREAIEARNAKRKKVDPDYQGDKSKPHSVAEASELAKKLLREANGTLSYKGVSAKKVFEKFKVFQTLSSKEKLVELIKKVDSKDAKFSSDADPTSFTLNIKD